MNILLHNDIRLPEDSINSLPRGLTDFYSTDFMSAGRTFLDYIPIAADFVLPVTEEDLIEQGFSSEAIDFALKSIKDFSPDRMWLLLPTAKELSFYTEAYTGRLQIPQLILSDISRKRFISNNRSISLALEYLRGCDGTDPAIAFRYAVTIRALNLNKVRHRSDALKNLLLSEPLLYLREYGKEPRLLSPDKAKRLSAWLTDLRNCETEAGCFADPSRPVGELIAVSRDSLESFFMKLTEGSLIFHRFGRLRFIDPKEVIISLL